MTTAFNDVGVLTATTGTGTMTLGAAINPSYLTPAEAGVATGTVVSYLIYDGSDVEGGIGTYTSAGTTLSRDTVTFSKISGTAGTTKISLSGNAQVRFVQLAADHIPIDSAGRVILGGSAALSEPWVGDIPRFQNLGGTASDAAIGTGRWTADANGPKIYFHKSRNATPGSLTIVQSGDNLGQINWIGDDGTTSASTGARIQAVVDGTPGDGDMPGRLEFLTTADAASSPTERMRIDKAGNVIVSTAAIATNATDGFLYVPTCAGTPTGTPTTYTGRAPIVVDTTNNKLYFYSGGAWRDAGP